MDCGVEERFEAFYARDYPRLYAALRLVSGDPDQARDAVQAYRDANAGGDLRANLFASARSGTAS